MAWFGLYAGLLGFWGIFLGARASAARAKYEVSLGDGGNAELLVKVRGFGNFAEWTPWALIMIWVAIAAQAPGWAIHAMGVALVAGRLVHPFGLDPTTGSHPLRILGNLLSLLVVLAGSVFGIYAAVG